MRVPTVRGPWFSLNRVGYEGWNAGGVVLKHVAVTAHLLQGSATAFEMTDEGTTTEDSSSSCLGCDGERRDDDDDAV